MSHTLVKPTIASPLMLSLLTMPLTSLPTCTANQKGSTPQTLKISELGDLDYYDLAIEISKIGWNLSFNVILVATDGKNLVDTLTVAPLAKVKSAPILFTSPKGPLTLKTYLEIQRLRAKNVYIAGNASSFPTEAVQDLQQIGITVHLLGGTTSHETAVNIARELKKSSTITQITFENPPVLHLESQRTPATASEETDIFIADTSDTRAVVITEIIDMCTSNDTNPVPTNTFAIEDTTNPNIAEVMGIVVEAELADILVEAELVDVVDTAGAVDVVDTANTVDVVDQKATTQVEEMPVVPKNCTQETPPPQGIKLPIVVCNERLLGLGFPSVGTYGIYTNVPNDTTTIDLVVPYGTSVVNLTPIIDISHGTTLFPPANTPQDFSNPVTYTLTTKEGSEIKYTVTVKIAEEATQITDFYIVEPFASGVIDTQLGTIKIAVPEGTDITNLTPIITLAPDATISPNLIVAQDFTKPVTYTVTSKEGKTRDWYVEVS